MGSPCPAASSCMPPCTGEPTFELPDGFRQLRAVLATSAAVATEVSEAAKKKATGGQDA